MSYFIKETSSNQANRKKLADRCSVNDTLAFVGKRWLMAVLYEISIGHFQFSTLAKLLPGISQHILASRLRELEKQELISKTIVPEAVPVQIHYAVMPKGTALLRIVDDLHHWRDEWGTLQDGAAL